MNRNRTSNDSEPKFQGFEASLQQMRQLNVTGDGVAHTDGLDDQVRRKSPGSQSGGQRDVSGSQSVSSSISPSIVPDALAQEAQSRPTDLPDSATAGGGIPFDILLLPEDTLPHTAFLARISNVRSQLEAEMDPRPFKRQSFARLPPKEYLLDMEQTVIEEVQLFCPSMTSSHLSRLIDAQYAAGPDNNDDNPARFAIVNVLFATAMRWRLANDSFEQMSVSSWCYFKNAYAIFPELIVRGYDVLACEALLAMATFSLGTADVRTTSQLASAAARTLQILGLDKRETYVNLDAVERERRKRVFWAAHILNTDMMVKFGLPTPLHQGEAIEYPAEEVIAVGDTAIQPLSFVKNMARLSQIQMRIHERFSQYNLHLQSGTDHHAVVVACKHELKEWRSSLPGDLQPDPAALLTTRELETPVALLHLVYLNALIKTHMALARMENASRLHPSSPLYSAWLGSESLPTIEQSNAKCTSAARATIDLLRLIPSQPYVHIWALLCYPVMASLVLLWSSLEEPTGPHAQINVRTMGQFVQFLAGVKEEGCDVRSVLDGCSKLYKIAKYVVHTQRTNRFSRPLEEDQDVRDQLEALRVKLSSVTDWMHLAQGLLSNMPVLVSQAREIFAEVLGMEQKDGEYGLFAPESLQPHRHNVSFGPE
ncbi:fungal-specific transcription factor domain-containing protein [Colletotrichum cereale]|nr:fungal-specific transcription factor domain-containing protein [Colletotrichum cereale]